MNDAPTGRPVTWVPPAPSAIRAAVPPPPPAAPLSAPAARPLPPPSPTSGGFLRLSVWAHPGSDPTSLLEARGRLVDEALALDERRARVLATLQQVGEDPPDGRPFTGAHPVRLSDLAELDAALVAANERVDAAAARLSASQLQLLELQSARGVTRGPLIAVLVSAAAALAAVALLVWR